MALDQVHEQNNEFIKGVGGATHLVNRSDESALIRWELCGSELAKMISDFEDLSKKGGGASTIKKHHEDNESFRSRFSKDLNQVITGFCCNPFDLSFLTAINNTNITFPEEVSQTTLSICDAGEEQFQQFWNDRLIQVKIPINATIKCYKFKLPGKLQTSNNAKYPPLNQSMITKLRSACNYRNCLVLDLFTSEIFGVAQSISENSIQLYHGTKSDILKRFRVSQSLYKFLINPAWSSSFLQ